MSDDATAVRSRAAVARASGIEHSVASAMLAEDGPASLPAAAEIGALQAPMRVATGCDVALLAMKAAAMVMGNPDTTVTQKRAWADSDGEIVADRIARSMASCEDDAGVARSRRSLTANLIKSF